MFNESIKNKKTIAVFLLIFVLFAAAVAVFTVYDYRISSAIADRDLLWTKILDVMGEIPALLFSGFNVALIIAYLRKNDVKHKNIYYIVLGILLFVSGFYPMHKILTYASLSKPVTILLCTVCGIVVGAIFTFIVFRFDDSTLKKYVKAAATCVGIAVSVLVIINIMKFIWGRPRFYNLNDVDTFYSPWYLPQWFSGNRSFPSGHTANATTTFMLSIYFPKQRKWLCPLLALWIAVIAVSRVFAGAHFVTDVLFGCAVTALICYIWCRKTGAWSELKAD